ncbi:hypothetical protein GOBAR_DD11587 [Gossypium barbadense]|nr:hypothetical protein GOBAR_DD11587 [Gossypium barbadense]
MCLYQCSGLETAIYRVSDRTLPDDRYEANKLKKMAKRYIVNDGKLFKRGLSGIRLRCLSGDEAMEVMHQSHAGTLAEHQGGLWVWKGPPLFFSLGICSTPGQKTSSKPIDPRTTPKKKS